MDRWEYTIFSGNLNQAGIFGRGQNTAQEHLNELGRQGWELVNAVKTLSNALLSDEYTFFLKRRIG
ncbi:MAG: DUF4177 domain-containing protein [Anaerolineaceae bacterium]|jgi:hypothetical protein